MSPSIHEGDTDEEATHEEATEDDSPRCPACRTPMYRRHCKFVCPNHGVVVDCSDPFAF